MARSKMRAFFEEDVWVDVHPISMCACDSCNWCSSAISDNEDENEFNIPPRHCPMSGPRPEEISNG